MSEARKPGSDGRIRKTASEWAAETRVYLEGTQMVETDTGWFKMSDGVQTFAAMGADAYFKPEGDLTGGGQTPVGIPYVFRASTSIEDTESGEIRLDSDIVGMITRVCISQTDGGAYPTDQGAVLATLSAGGLLYVNTASDDGVVAVFKVTACADSGTYYTLTGSYLSGVLPNDGAAVRVTIAPVEVTGVKRYVALLSQSGTDAPVATVLENSLGGTVVWSRSGAGDYRATLTGAFPDAKTIATPFEFSTTSDGPFYFVRNSDDELGLYNNGGTEYSAVFSSAIPITITVYP